jgi:succinyl-diaminopimelate desuccinylase
MPIDKDLLRKLTKRVDSYRDDMVAFQKELTAIVALGPENQGEGEWKRARFLTGKIKSFGLSEITEYNSNDDRVPEGTRPNLVIRLAGEQRHPAVWVMAHMDTVPPGDMKQWDSDPFQVVEKDGKLYGRGVEDNQQGLVSALYAMRAMVEEGVKPPADVCLMLVSDEETGNALGIEHVLATAPDLVDKSDIVIVPDSGNPDGSMVEVAEKSILWIEFVVKGKQVHASMPHVGINAARAAAYLTVRVDQTLAQRFNQQDPVFDPPGSTFEPTKREANVPNVNTIPGEERLCFDCRILPEFNTDDVLKTAGEVAKGVEHEFNVKVEVNTAALMKAAPATPVDAPVVVRVMQAVSEVLGVKPQPMGIGGGTVGAVFRRHGIPAVVWSTMDDLAHQPNEYCVIDNMVQDAKVFAHVFLDG